MQFKRLSKEDLSDILYGCTILGTGGGGELDEGFNYINKAFDAGKEFKLIDFDHVPDNAKICTPYMLGAISDLSAEEEQEYSELPQSGEPSIMTALRRLEQLTGDSYFGTICCELGGSNTAISFYVAAMSNGYIIDADPAGRAVPEITHSTYYLNNLPAAPIVAANEFGECFVCENVKDDMRAERLVRALAKVSRNDIAAIDHATEAKNLRGAVIQGTISTALELGKAYRLAKADGSDIAQVIADKGNGYVAFRGKTQNFNFETKDGFTLGYIEIEGVNNFEGDTYSIDVKNENMLARKNGVIDVTIPELICCIDLDKGEPITNPNHLVGMNVAVIILPAPKEFLTEKGLKAFGPAYLGLADEYFSAVEKHFKQY
ncbi:DUF917 domain-containing protein [Colwellia sp. RE-S-Sl-9]